MATWRAIWAGALAGALASAVPARADVIAQTDLGFVSRNVVVVAGSPAAVWKRLVAPSGWWSSDHTFSGDAANMSLDPVAGGCFCEKLPADDGAAPRPGAASHPLARGGVEHMRVVFVDRTRALRMVGALGPLQSEAVSATLTVTLKEVDGGTRVIFEYVVGGYMRYPADKIATAVDIVMGNQLLGLAKLFGPVARPQAENPPPPPPESHSGGLDKNGLLLPRGKVWSLPVGPPPERAAPEAPAPTIAPLPTAPVQDDSNPSGGTTPAKKRAARKRPAPVAAPAPEAIPAPEATVTPVPDGLNSPPPPDTPEPAPPRPVPKAKAPAKKPAKPVKKPAPPPPDEPTTDSVNSAFDAAFGGAPHPAPDPPPQ
jgi:hypothetical protein